MADFYVYILHCSDDTLYTGWTVNLTQRLRAHNEKKGAKYTRSRLPVRLVYAEQLTDKNAAMRREYAIKQLCRQDKYRLIATYSDTKPTPCT